MSDCSTNGWKKPYEPVRINDTLYCPQLVYDIRGASAIDVCGTRFVKVEDKDAKA